MYNKKLKIIYLTNFIGWAFWKEAENYKKYSNHEIIHYLINIEVNPNSYLRKQQTQEILDLKPDVIVLQSSWHYFKIKNEFFDIIKSNNIKLVVQYNSHIELEYYAKHADLALPSSKILYKAIKNKFNYKNLKMIHHYVDSNIFIPNGKYNNNRIGWCGNISNVKCKRPHLLYGIGEPILIKSDYKGQKETNKEINYQPMVDFYNQIDIGICTSITEGTFMPNLEAMVMKKVVLSTDVGTASEILDSEFIFKGSELEIMTNMRNKIYELRDDLNKYKEVSERNYEYAIKNLDWVKNVDKLDNIYQEVYDKPTVYDDEIIKNIKINKKQKEKEKIIKDKIKEKYIKSDIIIDHHKYINLFRALKNSKIKFCLLENSVKDCYMYHKNVTENRVSLQVSNSNDAEILIKIIRDFKVSRTIKIEDKIIRTKKCKMYDSEVEIPFPTVRYLNDIYGKGWNKVNGEKII